MVLHFIKNSNFKLVICVILFQYYCYCYCYLRKKSFWKDLKWLKCKYASALINSMNLFSRTIHYISIQALGFKDPYGEEWILNIYFCMLFLLFLCLRPLEVLSLFYNLTFYFLFFFLWKHKISSNQLNFIDFVFEPI